MQAINFVLEVQPYLFVFESATLWASFALFWAIWGYFIGPLCHFCGQDQVQQTFLEPTSVDCQFLFLKCSPTFLFLIWPDLWPFWHFFGYFWGWGKVKKIWDPPIQTINFGFGSTAPSFVFNTLIFGASFALFWAPWGYFLAL